MRYLAKALIRFYQSAISPQLGVVCRYEPSCSHYAYQAIDRHGAVRGSWLALRRLGRCHPGRPDGYDPVPDREPGGPERHTSHRTTQRPTGEAEESKAH